MRRRFADATVVDPDRAIAAGWTLYRADRAQNAKHQGWSPHGSSTNPISARRHAHACLRNYSGIG